LSPQWRPVSAVYEPKSPGSPGAVLRIGYLTPSGGSVQLIESNAPRDGLLIAELGDNTTPQGVVSLRAASWDAFQVRNGEQALVQTSSGQTSSGQTSSGQTSPGRTLIVIGSADPGELRTLAGAVGTAG